jgi:hypothetical protein
MGNRRRPLIPIYPSNNIAAIDRGCFACMLGREDGRTLFIAAAIAQCEVAMNQDPGTTGWLLVTSNQPAPPRVPSAGG